MNRRNFLAFLLASAAGEALAQTVDLERLLWVPKPIITVPDMGSALETLNTMRVDVYDRSLWDASFESLRLGMREIYNKCSAPLDGHTPLIFYTGDEDE